jgi:DNA topoisomerase-2
METKKQIAKKYRKLTDIEHVLHRPSMYIGSVKPHTGKQYLYDGHDITYESITYNPGFLKLFDEILSNSIDEHRRNSKLNEIRVTVDLDENQITIWDNGGIPVEKHPIHKEWIPEMIFSNLKAGSNFNDEEDRIVAGTNGVGSTLTNIFSKKFSISTCDRKNKFSQTFTKNMHKRSKPSIASAKRGFTQITYIPDLERFGMTKIDEISLKLIYKRCIDAVACNTKLTLHFTVVQNKIKIKDKIKYSSFKDYVSLYTNEFFYEESKHWKIAFSYSSDGYKNVSFVNTVNTKDGGTHVEYIANQLINHLRQMIKKKHKVDAKPSEIKNHLCVYIDSTIINSLFSSQTKEKLITEGRDFQTSHEVSLKIAKRVFSSEIIESLLDWIERKQLAAERAELRKLNKNLSSSKVLKLIDAKKKGNRSDCILGIYEGLSALSAVRKFRDSQKMGAFPLKGKFLNVKELPNSKVIQNEEVKNLMASIGLKLGEEPNNLRYGKIYIYTDADPDGDSIAALLINFFNKYWPELFENGIIYKVLTPLVVVKKGKDAISFYNNTEFQKWLNNKKINHKTWNIEYKKGLAALEDDEYKEIITNPVTIKLVNDKLAKDTLDIWFGKDSSPRKDKILQKE